MRETDSLVSVRSVIIVSEVVHKANINEIKIPAMLRFDIAKPESNLVSIITLEGNNPIAQGKQFEKHVYTDHTVTPGRDG